MLNVYQLDDQVTENAIRFYLESSIRFRFPFYDPENPLRKNGMFVELEETVLEMGEVLRKRFGDHFLSINLRGSWLRGIPLRSDDIDLLFIIRGLSEAEQGFIMEFARSALQKKHAVYRVCDGKMEGNVRVEPISFLDFDGIGTTLRTFMYGLDHFMARRTPEQRDEYQDSYFGSKIKEKLLTFLKSGILIPYIGWIYGKERKEGIFGELARHLPIPTRRNGIFSASDIDIAKDVIRQIFVARNLVYPGTRLKSLVSLEEEEVSLYKKEALELYNALEPLETIHARAVLNYIYTAALGMKLFGRHLLKNRVDKFARDYDGLVEYLLSI